MNDLIGAEQRGPLRALLDAVDHAARAIARREQACLKIAEDHHLKRIDVANRHMRGLARYYLGEFELSLDDCLDGANNAAEVGHQRAEMAARCSVGPILVDLDDLVCAKRESELGLELAKKLGASCSSKARLRTAICGFTRDRRCHG